MTKKIKSSKGATLIFALVGLLVSAMVSAVIIYAAENNARRVRSDQASEQARLAIDSVAELLTDEIVNGRYEGVDKYKITTTYIDTNPTNSTTTETYEGSFSKDGTKIIDSAVAFPANISTIAATVYDWCKDVQHKDAVASITSLVCKQAFVITADNMQDVCVELSMEPGELFGQSDEEKELANAEKYYLTAKLYLADSTSDIKSETVVMTFMASADDSIVPTPPITESEIRDEESHSVTAVVSETNSVTTTVDWYPTNVIVNLYNNL